MRSFLVLSAALVLGSALGAVGCSAREGDGNANAAAVDDGLTAAKAAQDVIFGKNAHCKGCHNRDDVRKWSTATFDVAQRCFSQATPLTPAQRIACLSDDPTNPQSSFSPKKMGVFAAGGAFLANAFQAADPSGERLRKFQAASMPLGGGDGFTSQEFITVVNWMLSGMPAFNEAFGPPPEPPACVPSISPELAAHVTEMKSAGWGARLAEASTPMYGCAAGADPKACLGDLPEITTTFGATGVAQTMRQIRELPFRTHYWVRSSADGRFVGFGQNDAAGILDLAAAAGAPPIQVDARYDPSFFPNNDGVSFAGTDLSNPETGPIRVCRQSVLTNASTQAEPKLTLKESGCSEIVNTVYQSVGAALDGSTFWMSAGDHVNDDGGNDTFAPSPGFENDAVTYLVPMISDGVSYQPKQVVEVPIPLEGDQILSPSSKLLVTRFGSTPGHRGFHIRRINTTTSTDNKGVKFAATTDVVGTICGGGSKASLSFDERFVVTHEYVDPAASNGLPAKSSNIMMHDLVTGDVIRVTNMKENQFAFSPHFRADGWLYFIVRDMNPGAKETIVASDVALKRLAPPPAAK
jgi:hypothetical protein